jgi:hypothetical protein
MEDAGAPRLSWIAHIANKGHAAKIGFIDKFGARSVV